MRRTRRHDNPQPMSVPPTPEQVQFLYLSQLAWALKRRGLAVSVQLPRRDEPCVSVQRASGPLLVRASLRGERWVFTWGRGRDRRVDALDECAYERVWEVAQ
ncbi:hypothetical protein GCM10012289_46880 [Nonomuraea cavernae]|uniref:Uncharacterized protein n=1 Tax=Nonomuraea cavernae TaxID=2045107 RepID=A0A917Z3V8_9ACTN|nr:hypothetical protein GCM10012289_46880 [Nonomuraea cavernae]